MFLLLESNLQFKQTSRELNFELEEKVERAIERIENNDMIANPERFKVNCPCQGKTKTLTLSR